MIMPDGTLKDKECICPDGGKGCTGVACPSEGAEKCCSCPPKHTLSSKTGQCYPICTCEHGKPFTGSSCPKPMELCASADPGYEMWGDQIKRVVQERAEKANNGTAPGGGGGKKNVTDKNCKGGPEIQQKKCLADEKAAKAEKAMKASQEKTEKAVAAEKAEKKKVGDAGQNTCKGASKKSAKMSAMARDALAEQQKFDKSQKTTVKLERKKKDSLRSNLTAGTNKFEAKTKSTLKRLTKQVTTEKRYKVPNQAREKWHKKIAMRDVEDLVHAATKMNVDAQKIYTTALKKGTKEGRDKDAYYAREKKNKTATSDETVKNLLAKENTQKTKLLEQIRKNWTKRVYVWQQNATASAAQLANFTSQQQKLQKIQDAARKKLLGDQATNEKNITDKLSNEKNSSEASMTERGVKLQDMIEGNKAKAQAFVAEAAKMKNTTDTLAGESAKALSDVSKLCGKSAAEMEQKAVSAEAFAMGGQTGR